jgi:hypothetical protein
MALFKGRDAEKLPLLTQFYQVEVPYPHTLENLKGSELETFLLRIEEELHKSYSAEGYVVEKYVMDTFLTEGAHIHDLVTTFMTALVDGLSTDTDGEPSEWGAEPITFDFLTELEEYINKYIFSMSICSTAEKGLGRPVNVYLTKNKDRFKLLSIYSTYKLKDDFAPSAFFLILKEVHDLLLFDKKSDVVCCEECFNIFIQENKKGDEQKWGKSGDIRFFPVQRFCSRRCAARNGQRRRRDEKRYRARREEMEISESPSLDDPESLDDPFIGEDAPPPPPRLKLRPAVSLPQRPSPRPKKEIEDTLL